MGQIMQKQIGQNGQKRTKTKQQAIMTKFKKLMPVSHIVRAFCKAMKSLIEDEVVVNDMECQLKVRGQGTPPLDLPLAFK